MAKYVELNGTSSYLTIPSMTHTKVVTSMVVDIMADKNQFILSTSNQYWYITTSSTDTVYASSYPIKVDGTSLSNGSTTKVTSGKKSLIELEYPIAFTSTTDILSRAANPFFGKGKVFDVKVYNGNTLVAHYNMDTGTLNDQTGNERHITTYGDLVWGEEPVTPIGTVADLQLIRNDPTGLYKLTNDIDMSGTSYSTYVIDGTFSGILHGDGYSFKGVTSSAYSFFNAVTGTITKLGIEYASKNSVWSGMVCYNLNGGTLSQLNISCTGIYFADSNFGIAVLIQANSTIENCKIHMDNYRMWQSSNVATGSIFGRFSGTPSGVTIRNNVAYIFTTATKPFNAIDGSFSTTNSDVSNNIYYSNMNGYVTQTTGTVELTLANFQNPDHSAYSTFNKVDIWKMQSGQNPALKAFIKIVEKIQQEIVKAYSRIATSKTDRFISKLLSTVSFAKKFASDNEKMVKVLKNVDSFTQGISSKISVTKDKLKSMKAFSRKIQSETSSKKKANKQATSFTGQITGQSFAEAIKRTFIQIASFAEKMIGNITKKKKQSKLKKGFTKPFESQLIMKKKVGRMIKAFSESFESNVIRNVSVSIFVQGFVEHMKSSSFAELFRKRVAQVISHTGIIISKVSRFSNIYKFVKMTVNSGVKEIVSNVSKTTSVKRMVESYMKSFSSRSIYTFILASAKNVMAIISHRFNQVRLYKHENETDVNTRKHATKINIKDDGGEG